MHSFKDKTGQEWSIALEVQCLKRVWNEIKDRDGAPINLADNTVNLLERLSNDSLLLVDILWVIVKPQADGLGVTCEQWCKRMDGDVLDDAKTKFMDELIDFSPPRQRGALKQLMAKALTIQTERAEKMIALLTDGTVEKLMDGTGSVSDTPASSV